MLNFNEEKGTGQQNTIRYGLVYVFITIEIF